MDEKLQKMAKKITRTEFLKNEKNEETCIGSRFDIGYKWMSEQCKSVTCEKCITEAIKKINFKDEL